MGPSAGKVCRRSSHMTQQTPMCQQELEGEKLRVECVCVSSQARKITTQTLGVLEQGHTICSGERNAIRMKHLMCY